MIKRTLAFVAFASILACGSPQSKAFKSLQEQEKTFYTKYKTVELKKEDAQEMIDVYQAFLDENPNFEKNPDIMLRYADVYMGTKQYFMALGIFDSFERKYPDHKKKAYVLFNKGYACELAYKGSFFNKHRDFAFAYYKEFLEKYPKHTLASSVKFSLEELNKIQPKVIK